MIVHTFATSQQVRYLYLLRHIAAAPSVAESDRYAVAYEP